MIEPGDVIHDRYEIERLIGAGGMGLIFRARDRSSDQLVALKVLRPTGDLTEKDVQRFHREARLLSQLDHPHVLDVSEVGELESGMPFLVMELLEGRDLREEIKVRASFPVDEAVGYVIQACTAVSAVHAAGIIHRDIKPQNLYITQLTGVRHLKLLDFGISKNASDGGEATLTATQGTLGTPQYMSPEQILGAKNVDERTDVWALGVILYFLLAGRLPFSGPSPSAVIAAIPTVEPPPLVEFRKDIPPELISVVNKCLSKNVSRRYQSALELSNALRPFAPEDGDIIAPAIDVPSTVPPIVVRGRSPLLRSTRSQATSPVTATLPQKVEVRPVELLDPLPLRPPALPSIQGEGLGVQRDVQVFEGGLTKTWGSAAKNRRNLVIGLIAGALVTFFATRFWIAQEGAPEEEAPLAEIDLDRETATVQGAVVVERTQAPSEPSSAEQTDDSSGEQAARKEDVITPTPTPPRPQSKKVPIRPAPRVAPKAPPQPAPTPGPSTQDAPPLFL